MAGDSSIDSILVLPAKWLPIVVEQYLHASNLIHERLERHTLSRSDTHFSRLRLESCTPEGYEGKCRQQENRFQFHYNEPPIACLQIHSRSGSEGCENCYI